MFIHLTAAVVTVAIFSLLVINYPRFKHEFDLEKKGVFKKFDHGLLLLNLIVYVPFLMMMYGLYFYLPKIAEMSSLTW